MTKSKWQKRIDEKRSIKQNRTKKIYNKYKQLDMAILDSNMKYFNQNKMMLEKLLSNKSVHLSNLNKSLCLEILHTIKIFKKDYKNGKKMTNADIQPIWLLLNNLREIDIEKLSETMKIYQRKRSPIYLMCFKLKQDIKNDLSGKIKYDKNINNMLNEIVGRIDIIIEKFLHENFESFDQINELIDDLDIIKKKLKFID